MQGWVELLLLKAGAVPELLDNARINIVNSLRRQDRPPPLQCAGCNGSFAGRLCIVTGANAGVGFDTSAALARRGANVIMACRSAERGEAAVQRVREMLQHISTMGGGEPSHNSSSSRENDTHALAGEAPAGSVEFAQLDLSRLASVRDFVRRCPRRPDLVICNAGLMAPEERMETPDGLEQQFQVLVLGIFCPSAPLSKVAPPSCSVQRDYGVRAVLQLPLSTLCNKPNIALWLTQHR